MRIVISIIYATDWACRKKNSVMADECLLCGLAAAMRASVRRREYDEQPLQISFQNAADSRCLCPPDRCARTGPVRHGYADVCLSPRAFVVAYARVIPAHGRRGGRARYRSEPRTARGLVAGPLLPDGLDRRRVATGCRPGLARHALAVQCRRRRFPGSGQPRRATGRVGRARTAIAACAPRPCSARAANAVSPAPPAACSRIRAFRRP